VGFVAGAVVGPPGFLHLCLVDVPPAVELLREAGHDSLAGELQSRLVGRNVIEGRWTFQVVEEYDDGYYRLFKELEAKARDSLVLGKRHLYEAEMKEDRRTRGNPDHTAVPK